MSEENQKIWQFVRELNESWIDDSTEELNNYFHPRAVIYNSGTHACLRGKEEVVKSYHDFRKQARIHHFREGKPEIDCYGEGATVLYDFEISYEMAEKIYAERGKEILFLQKEDDMWQVVWRTIVELRHE